MKLSQHFTLAELTGSDYAVRHGIDNVPDGAILDNLSTLAQGLERVRALLVAPMFISSGYRCPELNAALKGARRSAHLRGLAADFVAPGFGSPLAICRRLEAEAAYLNFDQLIQEGRWVHIAFPEISESPRLEVLTAHFGPGGTTYTKGLA